MIGSLPVGLRSQVFELTRGIIALACVPRLRRVR
jgi:hypothetical protein